MYLIYGKVGNIVLSLLVKNFIGMEWKLKFML